MKGSSTPNQTPRIMAIATMTMPAICLSFSPSVLMRVVRRRGMLVAGERGQGDVEVGTGELEEVDASLFYLLEGDVGDGVCSLDEAVGRVDCNVLGRGEGGHELGGRLVESVNCGHEGGLDRVFHLELCLLSLLL
jgi:hypothetical protein